MSLMRLKVALGHDFQDTRLLELALTHRSSSSTNNERLEFLGDAVLNCVVSDSLFARFDSLKEGDLSRWRANIVRQESLAAIGVALDLGQFIRLGEGEQKSGGRYRPSIIADTLEALFGAIYLDGGFDAAAQVIRRLIAPAVQGIVPNDSAKDAKTLLQEALQARGLELPRYELIKTRGAAHEQQFEIECQIPKLAIRTLGFGRSRRIAEQEAAQLAVKELD